VARERVEKARQRAKAIAIYGADAWENADLVAEVEAVCGEGRRHRDEWWFRCRWHEDRTPSLHVNADKRIWKCFGCQRGGGVLAWRKQAKEAA
jgi:hypothetical protein